MSSSYDFYSCRLAILREKLAQSPNNGFLKNLIRFGEEQLARYVVKDDVNVLEVDPTFKLPPYTPTSVVILFH